MLLFSRWKKRVQVHKTGVERKVAQKIDAMLQALAKWLQQKTMKLSKNQQKLLLFLFVIISATACFLLLVSSFPVADKNPLKISYLQKPRFGTSNLRVQKEDLDPSTSQRHQQDYEGYEPDLNATTRKRSIQDTQLRKGLIDSLKALQTIFSKKQKQLSWKRQHSY